MTALLIGTALAVLGLAYVLYPIVRGAALAMPVPQAEATPESSAIEALREIEFDQATGKLSPEDYATLKSKYTALALGELRAREGGASVGEAPSTNDIEDAAERMIALAKQRGAGCVSCGPRPEADALYCSDCGRHLGKACLSCGAPVDSGTARFCVACGAGLAA